jgi:hypothetical protein
VDASADFARMAKVRYDDDGPPNLFQTPAVASPALSTLFSLCRSFGKSPSPGGSSGRNRGGAPAYRLQSLIGSVPILVHSPTI